MQSVEETPDDTDINTKTSDLTAGTEEFGNLLRGLLSLYEQDLYGEFIDGAQIKGANETLERALLLVDSLKNRILRQSDELLESPSVVCSHHSSHCSLVSSTSSSIARLQVLADARAASQETQYTRLIAEKELVRRTGDAKTERIRQQDKAQHEKEMILGADKKAIVANAKLKVFEEAFLEQDLGRDSELPSPQVPGIKNEERTSQWVDSSHTLNPPPVDYRSRPRHTRDSSNTLEKLKPILPSALPKRRSFNQDLANQLSRNEDNRAQQDTPCNRQTIITANPFTDIAGSQLIETMTSVNQQIVAELAQQNLPKCQPDTFFAFLRGKWEKEISKFSENNGDAYSVFRIFSEVIQKHARIKNNPNINIRDRLANPFIHTPHRTGQNNKVLKTNADPNDAIAPTRRRETKRCPFHGRDGHTLEECKNIRGED